MSENKISGRKLKKHVLDLLRQDDLDNTIQQICSLPLRQVINPLISFLYNSDETVKWHAVSAIGAVVNKMADEDIESARIIMRRLVWNLNDESGGIGWGSPEAMGEIMARNKILAEEYSVIILSYIKPCTNYIENMNLQKGVLWGLARFAGVRPELVKVQIPYLAPFVSSKDPVLRGLALWLISTLKMRPARKAIEKLVNDNGEIKIYTGGSFEEYTIAELANMVLKNYK